MKKLSYEELKKINIKELQEIVYELGIDEALDIEDREMLIDLYLDYA